ncbi:ABC transporter permease [Deinococcus yavapaiensis]|uniref:ABC transporter permease n=1 Tax=Deinococcus yavapaiensis TaxID=309889 RepID=UPI000DA22F86|nr:ABC transporter permease [Deinococcus yavapaiensis]
MTTLPAPVRRRSHGWISQLVGVAALLLVWWFFTKVRPLFPSYVLPAPDAVLKELQYGLFGELPDGRLGVSIINSLRRVAIGYVTALALGLGFGMVLAASKSVRDVVGGWLTAVQSIPSIAFVPFAILLFGLNDRAVLFVVILEGFIPVTLAVSSALQNVPPGWRTAGRTLGASSTQLFTKVLLPASLPNLATGARLAWSFSWRALIGAELLTANPGLGQALEIGRNTANMALVLATILIVGVLGGLFDAVLHVLETRVRRNYGLEVLS